VNGSEDTLDYWKEFDKIYPGGAGNIEDVMENAGAERFLKLVLSSFSDAFQSTVSVFFTLFGICT
jgi:hypothetical protein